MLNTHALTNPSPADANLRTSGDPLYMLKEGGYDLNRYSYFHYKPRHINNRTADMINSGAGNHLTRKPLLTRSGIIPFPVPFGASPNHPVPVFNALIDAPIKPYDLIHSPLAPQFNPMSMPVV
jgi:hypothetical protein